MLTCSPSRMRCALLVDPHVHGGLLAAGADILELFDIVGQRQQVGRAGERFAAEIAAQAIADHRHAAHLGQLVQLLDLGGAEELGFVDQHAGHLRHVGQEVVVGVEGFDGALRPEARGDLAEAVAAVDRGGEQAHLLALLFIVVRHLQQGGRFAGVHRRIPEIKFCHCLPCAPIEERDYSKPGTPRASARPMKNDRAKQPRTVEPRRGRQRVRRRA